jgi:glycosyltransferase involved in cell wall biosynthesis
MEALHFGCPVLSSDIPSLREQLHGMGDSAIFFDPHQPADLVNKLLAFEPVRAETTERQQSGFLSMRERTWTDAAREWIEVLSEATVLSQAAKSVEPANRTQ